jgi:O-antigen/teichoic acid export membrane protein
MPDKPPPTTADPTVSAILRATTVTGISSAVNLGMGLLRMKVAALLLGPTGLGIVGLLQSAMGVATTVGDLGVRQAGTRAVAHAGSQPDRDLVLVRRALLWIAVLLGIFFGIGFYLCRHLIAKAVVGDPQAADTVGYVALGVAATIASGAPYALLNGHRKVLELGKVGVITAILGTLISVACLLLAKEYAVPVLVISAPIVNFIILFWLMKTVPKSGGDCVSVKAVVRQSIRILALGGFVVAGGIVIACSEFLVRKTLNANLGLVNLGLFTATWMIGTYYAHFLMMATSFDFFPRLTETLADKAEQDKSINTQVEMLLLLSAPILLSASTLSPYVLQIAYSSAFRDAADLFRLMVLGDVLRLTCYPLGFVLLAHSAGKHYLVAKIFESSCLVALITFLSLKFGLTGAGLGHIIAYGSLLFVMAALVQLKTGYRMSRRVTIIIAALTVAALTIILLSARSEAATIAVGMLFTGISIAIALKRIQPHRFKRRSA